MKLAVLGTGKIVEEALPVLKEIAGIELKAIVSTARSLEKGQALADQFGINEASSDFAAVLQKVDIDTVYVAVPNHLHFEMAKQALQAGKHVICEKPFTMTFEELQELVVIAKAKDLILLEAITNQYLGNFHFMKENLAQLGDIKIVECNYSQYSSRYDAFQRGEILPAFDASKGGGALRDLNIYNIHIVVGLFGLPKNIHYMANIERGVDTSGILMLDYDSFKVACIAAKDCSAEVRSTIQGNKGSLSILGPTGTLPELAMTLNQDESRVINMNSDKHRMFEEFRAFEDIISQSDFKTAYQALNHSLDVMWVLDKAAESLSL